MKVFRPLIYVVFCFRKDGISSSGRFSLRKVFVTKDTEEARLSAFCRKDAKGFLVIFKTGRLRDEETKRLVYRRNVGFRFERFLSLRTQRARRFFIWKVVARSEKVFFSQEVRHEGGNGACHQKHSVSPFLEICNFENR